MKVYLVDGTYELFRHYFAVPKARDASGREVGAVRGVLASLLAILVGYFLLSSFFAWGTRAVERHGFRWHRLSGGTGS